MSETYINREAAQPDEIRSLWVGDTPIPAAIGCRDCEVFSRDAIYEAIFADVGLQLSLLGNVQTGKTSEARDIEDRVTEEVAKRAKAGIEGSCPYIETVEDCWRGTKTPIDTTLEG